MAVVIVEVLYMAFHEANTWALGHAYRCHLNSKNFGNGTINHILNLIPIYL